MAPPPSPPKAPSRKKAPFLVSLMESQHLTSAASGAAAGALAAIVVCPLDVMKTRLQISTSKDIVYRSIAGGMRSIVREEGFKGLYRGLTPSLAALLPNWAVYFSVYEGLKKVLTTPTVAKSGKLSAAERRRFHVVNMIAAAGAGAATVFVTNPLWVAKTRLQARPQPPQPPPSALRLFTYGPVAYPVAGPVHLPATPSRTGRPPALSPTTPASRRGVSHPLSQVQHMRGLPASADWARKQYSSTRNCLRRIATEEGIGGLYSGLGPSLLGVGHVMIQFPVYEAGKAWLASERSGPDGAEGQLTTGELIVVSSAAKLAASILTYPHEVLRSRMHVEGTGPFNGIMRIARAVWAEGRMKGFYRGFVTNLVRTVPAGAVTITSFELISRNISAGSILHRRLSGEQERPQDLERRHRADLEIEEEIAQNDVNDAA